MNNNIVFLKYMNIILKRIDFAIQKMIAAHLRYLNIKKKRQISLFEFE